MARILLIGKSGQVGWELEKILTFQGELVAVNSAELNLTDFQAVRLLVRDLRPEIIVNAAAYTAVDRAEAEAEQAMAVNAGAPGVMAEEAARLGALIVHFSTDYIFDGEKNSPYREEDSPNPINVYGQSKLAGEKAIGETGAAHLIFRTSWVYGLRGKNFLLSVLRLAREKEELSIVNDQIGTPNWCRTVAEAAAYSLNQISRNPALKSELCGIYNLTVSGKTNWYEFAGRILAADPLKAEQLCRRINPIKTDSYPAAARRPRYSVLDNSKFQAAFGYRFEQWDRYLPDLFGEGDTCAKPETGACNPNSRGNS